MPDFTIEFATVCDSNTYFAQGVKSSKGDKTYMVRWEHTPDGPVEYGWTCECPGFKHRKKCKHVSMVEASGKRCAWNAEMSTAAEPLVKDGEKVCPCCEGPVTVHRIAV